jgi:hypothetical protein
MPKCMMLSTIQRSVFTAFNFITHHIGISKSNCFVIHDTEIFRIKATDLKFNYLDLAEARPINFPGIVTDSRLQVQVWLIPNLNQILLQLGHRPCQIPCAKLPMGSLYSRSA